MTKFYSYLDKLGMSSDEFFLDGENYKLSSKYHEEYKILEDNQKIESTKNENQISLTFKDIFYESRGTRRYKRY